jgi:hypothetical protein
MIYGQEADSEEQKRSQCQAMSSNVRLSLVLRSISRASEACNILTTVIEMHQNNVQASGIILSETESIHGAGGRRSGDPRSSGIADSGSPLGAGIDVILACLDGTLSVIDRKPSVLS